MQDLISKFEAVLIKEKLEKYKQVEITSFQMTSFQNENKHCTI